MKILFAVAVAAAMLGSAASAQMATDAAMPKMSAATMKKVDRCKAMAHDAMMKNATCMKMMKLYPAAFSGSVSSN